jgi:hypothetical protein
VPGAPPLEDEPAECPHATAVDAAMTSKKNDARRAVPMLDISAICTPGGEAVFSPKRVSHDVSRATPASRRPREEKLVGV